MSHLINLEDSSIPKKQRLNNLKKLLFQYNISLFFPWFKYKHYLACGFCCAMSMKRTFGNLKDYPELLIQKPVYQNSYPYWYPPGKLIPRIKCLRRAIKLLKDDIKRNNI